MGPSPDLNAGEDSVTTDTTEPGLERLICTALVGHACDPPAEGTVTDPPAGYGGVGWSGGNFHDYDREYASIWCSSRPSCVARSPRPPMR